MCRGSNPKDRLMGSVWDTEAGSCEKELECPYMSNGKVKPPNICWILSIYQTLPMAHQIFSALPVLLMTPHFPAIVIDTCCQVTEGQLVEREWKQGSLLQVLVLKMRHATAWCSFFSPFGLLDVSGHHDLEVHLWRITEFHLLDHSVTCLMAYHEGSSIDFNSTSNQRIPISILIIKQLTLSGPSFGHV